jgi:hypothetical protein
VISVGDSPMQRLTQAQYGNSVRALLGLKSVATSNIPANTEYKAFSGAASAGAAASTGGYDNGIRVVVETLLQSPNFLYRPEVGAVAAVNGNAVPLTDFELASRLSFFLWSSTPDDELLSAASANQLSDPSALQAQAQRLLADPRAREWRSELPASRSQTMSG